MTLTIWFYSVFVIDLFYSPSVKITTYGTQMSKILYMLGSCITENTT